MRGEELLEEYKRVGGVVPKYVDNYIFSEDEFMYFVDDRWSGTMVTVRKDIRGNYIETRSNDSPEQAGGYRDVSLIFEGKKYNLSNFGDKWDYAIIKGRPILFTFNDYGASRELCVIDAASSERIYRCEYRGNVYEIKIPMKGENLVFHADKNNLEVFDKLLDITYAEWRLN